MKRRTFLGLDLAAHSFRAVALQRQGREHDLTGARVLEPAAEVIRFSSRELNILDRFRFVSQLREVLTPLAAQEERLALSLPDAVGRTLLTEVETAFKTRQEGIEILKWQLKNSLPGEPTQTRIDYQPVGQTDAGKHRIMVAAVRSDILEEYEDAIEEAGFGAAQIDFHAFSLYNFYRHRFNIDDTFILVSIDGASFSLHFNISGQPVYFRSKVITRDVESVFQELSRTLVPVTTSFPVVKKAAVFMHTDWEERSDLQEALQGCFGKEVQVLDMYRLSWDRVEHGQPQLLAAAIGAAERLM